MKILRVATCQFSVEGSISHNYLEIVRLMREAANGGAEVAHFSESALSGYAGVDIPDSDCIDWQELKTATRDIQSLARKLRLWVLLGSTHPLTGKNKPHNSVYVINARGEIVERYDKLFCTGQSGPDPTFDLCYYSPGNRSTVFSLRGITCGILICFDYRFPELFRELKRQDVQVLFHSFHNARKSVVRDPSYNIWKTIVPATMSCRAAENHFWISANNSTTRPSCWPSFAVRPDGAIVGKLKLHQPGCLITEFNVGGNYFDAPKHWRENAMRGILHSGRLVDDPRSSDPRCL
jgi:predicted amidohydrolase